MKVLVVAGASGGHIFPALSFLSALEEKEKGVETLLVLPKRSESKRIAPDGRKVKYILTTQITLRISIGNMAAVFGYLLGVAQSFELMLSFNPDIVVGFGSIDSIPLIMFGWLFRAKTLIHEQNVIPGRANSLLAKFVDMVAVSFSDTKKYIGVNPDKVTVTGNPIRSELIRIDKDEALRFFGLQDRFTILIMGGSQGSSAINKYFLEAISGQRDRSSVQLIHIAGDRDANSLAREYERLEITARVYPFLREMEYAYSAADLAVCRAGASTIAELIHYALPAIIIPYPHAYAHQAENATVLKKMRSAVLIEDKNLEAGELAGRLTGLMAYKSTEPMRLNYGNIDSPAANELLAEQALSLTA